MVVVLPRVAPSAEQGGSDAPVVCQTRRTGYFAAMHSGRGGQKRARAAAYTFSGLPLLAPVLKN